MPDSVRKQIVSNIETTLAAIGGAGFNYTLSASQVYRYGILPSADADRPLLVIFHGREVKSQQDAHLGYVDATMQAEVFCYVTEGDGEEASDAVHDLYHDIEKALMADHTRGGLAIDTEIKGFEGMPEFDQLPDIAFLVTVEVRYEHGVTDPASLTGG